MAKIVYEENLPKIFEDIYYSFFKTKLIELRKTSYKTYSFYIKLVSKTDFTKGIKAVYDIYCDEGCHWELNVFESHFLIGSNPISSEYKITPIDEKMDLSNRPQKRLIIKYADL